MTYATTADITARYPGVLADSAPRDSNGALDAAAIDSALTYADALIDGRLAVRFGTAAVPVPAPVPPALIDLAVDLALHKLLTGLAYTDERQKRHDAALARLDRIASGREELIGLAPPATGAAGGQVRVAVPTAYGHVFKPKTRARSSGVKLAFASCLQMAGKELTGLYQMLAADVHALLTQGDWPYPADEAGWGIARDNTAWNDPAAFAAAHAQTMFIPGAAALSSSIEMLMQWDDHEPHLNSPWDGSDGLFDNWPSTVEAPVGIKPADLSVDPRVTYPWSDAYNAAAAAFAAYARHNPPAWSANHFGWSDDFGVDPVTGGPLLRVITPDLISERSFTDYTGPGKRLNLPTESKSAPAVSVAAEMQSFRRCIAAAVSGRSGTTAAVC